MPGAHVFVEAKCGDCHSLSSASARGTIGPDLDRLRPSADRVARQVRSGGKGMPSFAGRLTEREIAQLAEFVARTAKPDEAGKPEAFEPDDTRLAECDGDGSCYMQAFGNIAYRKGPKLALKRFERAIATNPAVEARCHPIAHTIGAGGLQHFDGDLARALAAGSAACGSGYYHGLLEWKLAGVSEKEVAGVARAACDGVAERAGAFVFYQCVHGLGHGLMLYSQYDLPKALALCHRLKTGFDQTSCTGGVFMENQQTSYGARSKWISEKDLLYPCPKVADRDKLYCYLLATSHILPAVSYDWRETAKWCKRSEPRWIPICFQSYGRDASGAARQDPAGIRERCGFAGDMEHECLFGAVRDVLNNESTDRRAGKLCGSIRRAPLRSYCFRGIGTMVEAQHRTRAERRAACRRFARGRDFVHCRRGAKA